MARFQAQHKLGMGQTAVIPALRLGDTRILLAISRVQDQPVTEDLVCKNDWGEMVQ